MRAGVEPPLRLDEDQSGIHRDAGQKPGTESASVSAYLEPVPGCFPGAKVQTNGIGSSMIGQKAIKNAVIGLQKAVWSDLYSEWTCDQHSVQNSSAGKFLTKMKSKEQRRVSQSLPLVNLKIS